MSGYSDEFGSAGTSTSSHESTAKSNVKANENEENTPIVNRPRILQTFRRESDVSRPQAKPPSPKQDANNVTSQSSLTQSNKKSVETKTKLASNHIETQTDWSWIQDMQIIERIRREGGDFLDEIYADTNYDNDNDDDDDDEDKHSTGEVDPMSSKKSLVGSVKSVDRKSSKPSVIDTVGPPKILQYQAETKKVELSAPSPSLSVESEPIENLGQFMKDFNVYIQGGNVCEFCGQMTKPWPSISDQENAKPDQLYCCNEYQEFVQALLEYQVEKEKLSSDLMSEKEKQKKNIKARQLAKERAEFRKLQLLMEKQKRMERIANKRLHEQQLQLQQQQLNQEKQAKAALSENSKEREFVKSQTSNISDKSGKEKPAAPGTISASNNGSALFADLATNDKSTNKIKPIRSNVYENTSNINFSNQVRSINYQLSNLKFLQEGWTVRTQDDVDLDEMALDEVEFDLYAFDSPFSVVEKSVQEKPLVIRKYKDGSTCLILFPDGSGNVFYPSGRIAMSITAINPGMHIMSIYSDSEFNPIQLASFDPYGNGCVNYPNGKIRLLLSPLCGIELDPSGARKKRWLWWDQEEHVHAPPLQPLIISLNSQIAIKVFNQDKINVCFSAEFQNCKFGVGSKLKISKPEVMPSLFKHDPNEIYLKRKKKRIDELLRALNDDSGLNLLKLPKIVNNSSNNNTTTPRLKASYDIFRLTQEKLTERKEPKSANQKSSKFLTVP